MRIATMGLVGGPVALIVALAGAALAQDGVVTDMATLNQIASKLDPDEYKFVQPVCTRCHTPSFFLHSRTWSEWQDIFHQMSGYGADATDDQWNHIHAYFARNLTQIDINHADEDELSAVLGVDEKTAVAIVQRRVDRKFGTAEEVEAVPGVDKAVIEKLKPRLLFAPLSDEQ